MKVRHGCAEHEFRKAMTVRRLLDRLNIVSEGVVVSVNGELVTTDTRVEVGDEVEIIRAISGGAAGTHAPASGR